MPVRFISGITGRVFRQFAVTIAASTVISAFNSLTPGPAPAAILLSLRGACRDPLAWLLDTTLGWFFWLFKQGLLCGTAATVGWRAGCWVLRRPCSCTAAGSC